MGREESQHTDIQNQVCPGRNIFKADVSLRQQVLFLVFLLVNTRSQDIVLSRDGRGDEKHSCFNGRIYGNSWMRQFGEPEVCHVGPRYEAGPGGKVMLCPSAAPCHFGRIRPLVGF